MSLSEHPVRRGEPDRRWDLTPTRGVTTGCSRADTFPRHYFIFAMAVAYGFHLCKNHPFVDGNKRVAGMAMFTFLLLNGLEPTAPEMDYYLAMMQVASGQMSKEYLTDWLQKNVRG